jgi:hypothetical protein
MAEESGRLCVPSWPLNGYAGSDPEPDDVIPRDKQPSQMIFSILPTKQLVAMETASAVIKMSRNYMLLYR